MNLFPIKTSADWMWPTLVMKDNLLYSKPADLNVNLIFKYLRRDIYLGTVAQPSCHIKLTITIVHLYVFVYLYVMVENKLVKSLRGKKN